MATEIVRISVFEVYCVFNKTLLLQQYFALHTKKYTSPAVMNGLNSSDAISIHHTFKIMPYQYQNLGGIWEIKIGRQAQEVDSEYVLPKLMINSV